MPIFTTVRSLPTHVVICFRSASSCAHAEPRPAGRAGRTAVTTRPITSSLTCPHPPSRTTPASSAARTYRRAVFRSTPACSATVRSPTPDNHARSTSRTSTTETSRNAIEPNLHVEHDLERSETAVTGHHGVTRRVVPSLATRWSHAHGRKALKVVACGWQATVRYRTPHSGSPRAGPPQERHSPGRHARRQRRGDRRANGPPRRTHVRGGRCDRNLVAAGPPVTGRMSVTGPLAYRIPALTNATAGDRTRGAE